MDNFELISLLQWEMQKASCDTRVEPQLVLALEKGLSADDFLVCCDSLFYRAHSRDLLYAEIKEDARKRSILQMHLSRSGLYDQLPEGLFYQPAAEGHV